MSPLHSPSRLRVSTVCQAALLTVAAATLWLFGVGFVVSIIGEFFRVPYFNGQQHSFTFHTDGRPLWKTVTLRRSRGEKTEYHDLDGQPVEMTERNENLHLHGLVDVRIRRHVERPAWREQIVAMCEVDRDRWYFEDFGERGQFSIFAMRGKRLEGYLGPAGFSKVPLISSQQFRTRDSGHRAAIIPGTEDGRTLSGFSVSINQAYWVLDALLVEPDGRRVHWIDRKARTCRVIHDGEPVLAGCFDWQHESAVERPRFVLRTQETLQVIAASEVTEVVRLPETLQRAAALVWARTKEGPLFVEPLFLDGWKLTWATTDGEVLRERIVPRRDVTDSSEASDAMWAFSLLQTPFLADFLAWAITHHEDSEPSSIDHRRARQLGLTLARERPDIEFDKFVLPLALLHGTALLWCVLAVRRLRRFGTSRGEQFFWGAWTLVCGLPGYLAFRVSKSFNRAPQARASVSINRWVSFDARACGVRLNERFADFVLAVFVRVGLPPGHAALVVKELRLAAGVGAVACLAYLLVVAKLTNLTGFEWMRNFMQDRRGIPFLADSFSQPFGAVTMLLAIGMAALQTSRESRGGAWLFLLHRPVSRRAILCAKLWVGLGVLLACSALPIVLYGTWAVRPGTHPSPFAWSMTTETWRLWWSMPPLYLGALLTLLRPARWWGTRLLPCVAGIGWLLMRERCDVWLWPTWQEFALVAVIDVVFALSLLLVVREREYP